MSYVRWGEDSDVYVFLNTDGHLECCGCDLPSGALNPRVAGEEHRASGGLAWFHSDNADGMIEHLREHQRAGQQVPGYAIERLEEDRADVDEAAAELRAGRRPRDGLDFH